jgi:hypothetical protein
MSANSGVRLYKFYCITNTSYEFSQLIGERVMNGSLPGNIMAMHNKFYWHRLSIEDKRGKSPGVEISLTELRQRIYRIVLPRQE